MSKATGMPLKLKTASMKMQSHRETTLNSCARHSAAAFVLAVVLGGCGGGGGGGSPGLNPGFVYPTLSNAVLTGANGGIASNYSLATNKLTLQPATVSVTLNSPVQSALTITVTGLGLEPPFSFTVTNPAAVGPPLANSPLSSCAACLLAGSVTSTPDSQPVSFIYLDPSAAGLTYSTLGLWSKPSSTAGHPDVGAAFSIGVVTRPQDLPILGSATYNGFMVGRYTDGSTMYAVGADAQAVAHFSVSGSNPASLVDFHTSNTLIFGGALLSPSAPPGFPTGLDLSGTLTYVPSSNKLTGDLTATGVGTGTLTGPATAKYYGPPTGAQATPAEFGGTFFVGNPTQQMNGSFALKK